MLVSDIKGIVIDYSIPHKKCQAYFLYLPSYFSNVMSKSAFGLGVDD